MGPAHQLTNNLIMDASDIGIVTFGGRDITIANNTVRARPGNYGMFTGIAMGPNTLGLISGDLWHCRRLFHHFPATRRRVM